MSASRTGQTFGVVAVTTNALNAVRKSNRTSASPFRTWRLHLVSFLSTSDPNFAVQANFAITQFSRHSLPPTQNPWQGWPCLYIVENKPGTTISKPSSGLRKWLIQSKMSAVRRTCFPPVRHVGQAGSAPEFCARAEALPALSDEGEHMGRFMPGGKKSSPRPHPRGRIPDGMEQQPFEPRRLVIAEGHRVR